MMRPTNHGCHRSEVGQHGVGMLERNFVHRPWQTTCIVHIDLLVSDDAIMRHAELCLQCIDCSASCSSTLSAVLAKDRRLKTFASTCIAWLGSWCLPKHGSSTQARTSALRRMCKSTKGRICAAACLRLIECCRASSCAWDPCGFDTELRGLLQIWSASSRRCRSWTGEGCHALLRTRQYPQDFPLPKRPQTTHALDGPSLPSLFVAREDISQASGASQR